MIAPTDESTPVRRKRLRRIIVVLAVLLAAFVVWRLGVKNSVITRARAIINGQPREDVHRLMGQPQISLSLFGTTDDYYSDMTLVELVVRGYIQEYLGFKVLSDLDKFAITVQYDSNHRVTNVRLPITADSSAP